MRLTVMIREVKIFFFSGLFKKNYFVCHIFSLILIFAMKHPLLPATVYYSPQPDIRYTWKKGILFFIDNTRNKFCIARDI